MGDEQATTAAMIVGLTAVAIQLGLPRKLGGAFALLTGLILAGIAVGTSGQYTDGSATWRAIQAGIVAGLAASGLWSTSRSLVEMRRKGG